MGSQTTFEGAQGNTGGILYAEDHLSAPTINLHIDSPEFIAEQKKVANEKENEVVNQNKEGI